MKKKQKFMKKIASGFFFIAVKHTAEQLSTAHSNARIKEKFTDPCSQLAEICAIKRIYLKEKD